MVAMRGGDRGIDTFGQVVGGVVHDVNNLLMIALACATKLVAELPADGGGNASARSIVEAVKRAGAASALAELAGFRCIVPPGVIFHANLEPELPSVAIEQCELDRIVTNLAWNAIDAVSAGDRIELRAHSAQLDPGNELGLTPGAYAVVGVFDSGSGIAPEHLDRLFAPFFTTKLNGSGIGLGLSSVDWLVRRRSGAVRVASRPKTGGTLFEVSCPRFRRPCASGRTPGRPT